MQLHARADADFATCFSSSHPLHGDAWLLRGCHSPRFLLRRASHGMLFVRQVFLLTRRQAKEGVLVYN